jgi:hypothetical protein
MLHISPHVTIPDTEIDIHAMRQKGDRLLFGLSTLLPCVKEKAYKYQALGIRDKGDRFIFLTRESGLKIEI